MVSDASDRLAKRSRERNLVHANGLVGFLRLRPPARAECLRIGAAPVIGFVGTPHGHQEADAFWRRHRRGEAANRVSPACQRAMPTRGRRSKPSARLIAVRGTRFRCAVAQRCRSEDRRSQPSGAVRTGGRRSLAGRTIGALGNVRSRCALAQRCRCEHRRSLPAGAISLVGVPAVLPLHSRRRACS